MTAEVTVNYSPGCARALYQNAVHPRVMFGPDDMPMLKDRIESGDGLAVMTALRAKVGRLVDVIHAEKDLERLLAWECRSWNDPGILIRMALQDIALVAALDEEPRTLDALRRVFAISVDWRQKAKPTELSALAYDIAYPLLPEEIRIEFRALALQSIRRRLEQTRKRLFKGAAGNITLGTALEALVNVLAIAGDPGVPDLAAEQAELLTMYQAVLHVAINPDGYPEEDTGYGTGVAAWLVQLGEALRRAGLYDPYAECPRYARFGSAMLHFVEPWGEDLANTGDHGDDFGGREFALARLAAETGNRTLLWLLGTLHYHHGKVHPQNRLPDYYIEVPLRPGFRVPATWLSLLALGDMDGEIHPAKARPPTAFMDRGRGIVSFRSGWDPDASFVVFDGSQRSPGGPGHFHDSSGHFSLSALGEYFAIDCGRYTNEQDQHNVVLVDGKSGRPLHGEWRCNYCFGRLIDYRPDPFVDSAAADSSHQHNCFWAWRCIGLVKGAHPYLWTVEDVNKHNDWAEFWWTLNTSPENTIAIDGPTATITGWRHGHHLDVHFALPSADSYPKSHSLALSQDVATVSAHAYIKDIDAHVRAFDRPADMVHGPVYRRPRLIGKVAGYNGRFMSLMIPRRRDGNPASVERIPSLDNSLAVRVVFDDAEDILIYAYEHNLLEAAGIRARGQWCVVRRARADGNVIASALGNGTSLQVEGKDITPYSRLP